MTALLLGARLAATSNRLRLLVTSVAIAFAVAFLLAALGAEPAHQATTSRLTAREPITAGLYGGKATPVQDVTLEGNPMGTWWRGHPIDIRFVAGVGRHPVPPGLTALPRPGDMVVSPDLARALAGPHRGELSRRLPYRQAGLIGRAGLAGPREMFAYVGTTPKDLADPIAVIRYGGRRYVAPTPSDIRRAGTLGAAGLLLPVLVLISTATRLSAASRDRRLAAIRLVGASPWQARLLIAGESLLFGVVGVVAGLVLFFGLRPLAAALVPLSSGVYPEDLRPSTRTLVVVLLGTPLLGCLVALASLRRLIVNPLGVRRQGRVRSASWWRLGPLLAGLLLLACVCASPTSRLLLVGGGGLVLVGLAVAAPAVSRAAGWAMERSGHGLAADLAGRRIGADPAASGRVVTGMVLVLFVAAWLLAFLPLLEQSRTYVGQALSPSVQRGLLEPSVPVGSTAVEDIRALPGVQMVFASQPVALTAEGSYADALSCTDLAALVTQHVDCGASAAYRIEKTGDALATASPTLAEGQVPVLDQDGRRVGAVRLPAQLPVLTPTAQERAIAFFQSDLVLVRSAVPAAALAAGSLRLSVLTDGRQDTVEAVRGALPKVSAFGVLTPAEERAVEDRVYLGYRRAVRLGLLMALLVGAASLAVTTADSAAERLRSTAGLVALGTPLRTLRRAALLQMLGPMLANVVVALAAAAVASWLYVSTNQGATYPASSLPWGGWGLTAVAAVVAVCLATAATLPLVNAAGRPDALRSE